MILLQKRAHETVERYGVGSCGPRGFYGTFDVHLDLEKALADFMGQEEGIIYRWALCLLSASGPPICCWWLGALYSCCCRKSCSSLQHTCTIVLTWSTALHLYVWPQSELSHSPSRRLISGSCVAVTACKASAVCQPCSRLTPPCCLTLLLVQLRHQHYRQCNPSLCLAARHPSVG